VFWAKIVATWLPRASRGWHLPALMARLRGRTRGRRSAPEQTGDVSVRFNRNSGSVTQFLGRSRGGFGSKIIRICDAAGRLVDFDLAPGQVQELAPLLLLLTCLSKAPAWTLADMVCDAKAFRSTVRAMGSIPVVPSRKTPSIHSRARTNIYGHRNLIERCW
jgi:hypothetical protein